MPRDNSKFIREQVKKHSLGKLVFLSSVGPRAWGFAPDNTTRDYQGIYTSKEDNTYWVSISGVEIDNNHAKDVTLTSLERIIVDILHSNINSLIFINSPAIYASKEFLEFKRRVNSNFSKQVYKTCQRGQTPSERKDYLYDFFFIGNGIAILEKKKVIANLPELNKKVLKIPSIDKIIKREKESLPFKNKQICKKILNQLKVRLKEANKKSRLPEVVDLEKLNKLKIVKKINPYFWHWPDRGQILKEKDKEKDMKKQKTKKPVRRRKRSIADKEEACKHQWAALMAQRGKKVIVVPSAKICLKCGLLKVGARTIRISRSRLDMGSLPIKSVGKIYLNTSGRLRIPVGTNLYE